jgi:hypothetical protein
MFKKKPFQGLLDKICKPGEPLNLDKMRPVVEPRGGPECNYCEIWVPKDDRQSKAEPLIKEEDEISLG